MKETDIKREIPAVVTTPGEREKINAFGDEMHLHLGTEATNNRFCLWTNITPPGGGPPPHSHDHEDEVFQPLSGDAEFLLDGKWRTVPAGTTVFSPRGSVHAFRNPGKRPLQMLIQTIPGGFDNFFRECAAEFAGGEPDMNKLIEISAEYGIHFALDRV